MLLIIACSLLTTISFDAMAALDTTKPEYSTYNYDNYLSYSTRMGTVGHVTYTIYADLSNMNTMKFPYALAVRKCCDNPSIEENLYVTVRINGNTIYYDDTYVIVENVSLAKYKETTTDIVRYRDKNAKVEYELKSGVVHCRNCGNTTEAQSAYSGLYFTDLRPKANIRWPELTLDQGGSFTYVPYVSDNTVRVEWGIRYSASDGFKLLHEGVNDNGLTVSFDNSTNMTISNVPHLDNGFDIGLFVYDIDGNLPGGTEFPYTPFVSHVSIRDNINPTIDVKKTLDTNNHSVIVEINGSDNVGLHDTPYSFDGGNTFTATNVKPFTEPGVVSVAIRDSAGNITKKDVYIDAIEIEKVNPKSGEPKNPVADKETGSGSGGNTLSGGGGNQNPSGSNTSPSNVSAGTNSLNNVKDKDKEFTQSKVEVSPLKNTDTIKNTSGSTSNNSGKNPNLKPSDISKENADDAFEKIRNNSEKYIIKMRESKSIDTKTSPGDDAEIDLKNIDKSEEEDYVDNGNEDIKTYRPWQKGRTRLFIIICIILAILLVLLLLFVLFFGVLIYADKETELTMLSDGQGIKMPVAISVVAFSENSMSVNLRELLSKYGYVYARFGAFFTYLHDGEKIKIMTKLKGEKKREIASETIHKEILIGNKGGVKK